MSQFLICKSEGDLSEYGTILEKVISNKSIYLEVINQYMHNENMNSIWVINNIHDMINNLADSLQIIDKICSQCDLMIFWYGSEFQELDRIYSKKKLLNYLKENINNPCFEVNLYVDLGSKNIVAKEIPIKIQVIL